ncbi:MAG: hypothetical protein OXL33_04730 [Chloroflexota bacterium]|nr:hypothetical protein [Chloroflexota bacterium]
MKTRRRRDFWRFLLLSIVTLGIWPLWRFFKSQYEVLYTVEQIRDNSYESQRRLLEIATRLELNSESTQEILESVLKTLEQIRERSEPAASQ